MWHLLLVACVCPYITLPVNLINFQFHFTIESYNQSLIAEASDYAIFVVREAYTDYQTINVPVGVSYPLPSKVTTQLLHFLFLATNIFRNTIFNISKSRGYFTIYATSAVSG